MASLSVHPLFFLFGIYYALTGKIFIFLICTLVALLHEAGHSFVAEQKGYKLNKVTLMPFGAVISGNIQGLKAKDEIAISLGGPIVNLLIAVFFTALWWLFPLTYTYTEVIVDTSLSLLLINMLPVFPLDGGRILFAFLSRKTKYKTAKKFCNGISIAFSILLLGLFILTCFFKLNLSILFFALFILFSVFPEKKENVYVRAYTDFCESNLLSGMEVKRHAVSENATVMRLVSLLEPNKLNEVAVYNKEGKSILLTQKEISTIIEKENLYAKIKEVLEKRGNI